MSASEISAGAVATGSALSTAIDAVDEIVRRARQERDRILRIEPTLEQKFDEDWPIVVRALKQLQQKITGYPQILNFTINRDETEVSAKIRDGSKRGFSYFILSRRHLSDRSARADRVWLSNVAVDEVPYEDAIDAMTELVQRITSRLA